MAFFDNFTASLKQKWLQFFQINRTWILRHMEVESVYTPDGGRRPPSYLILGVVNALEPKLAQLMAPFSKLNPDADTLIEVLELDFDPDMALGHRFNPQAVMEAPSYESPEMSTQSVAATVIDAGEMEPLIEESDELSDISLQDMSEEVILVESHQESVIIVTPPEADDFSDGSFDGLDDETLLESSEAPNLIFDTALDGLGDEPELATDESIEVLSGAEADAFGEMSFDEIGEQDLLETGDESSLETLNAVQSDEFSDMLSDVWEDDQTLVNLGEEGEEMNIAEDKQSPEDEEISRLFPNF